MNNLVVCPLSAEKKSAFDMHFDLIVVTISLKMCVKDRRDIFTWTAVTNNAFEICKNVAIVVHENMKLGDVKTNISDKIY